MSSIPFPAGPYRDADWAFTHPKDIFDLSLKQILFDAQSRVLEELHGSYFNAVEIYNLPLRTECWIEDAHLQEFAQDAGKIYLTLDYFGACLPLPRRMKKLGMGKEAFLYKYLCQRSLDNIQANSASLLKGLAISSLIPDEWFPEKKLEKLIENEIKRSAIYSHVEIDFDLNIPPGGLQWLSDATRETVTKVREELVAGQPSLVRLINSPGKLHGNRQVIVYACHEGKNGRLCLEIFEPGNPLEEHALQVVNRRGRLEVTEILGQGRKLPMLGLLYETYTPEPLPRECIPWWLRWMEVRQVWMRVLVWICKKRSVRFF